MSDRTERGAGLIGPNAVLQLLPVLERLGGPEGKSRMLAAAGIFEVPDGHGMIPEAQAARLHRQLRSEEPAIAAELTAQAGFETANYILRHRIPHPAQILLKALPKRMAARLLSRAIAAHAWTFVGSGELRVMDAWTFEITDNPLIRGEASDGCLCSWHASVFAQLYRTLVAPDCTCIETSCGAQHVGNPCRFEIRA